nr:hypothetical protein [Tanacetum cinerariifolium]
EIAIRRAKHLAELEAINKEAEVPKKQKKTKNQSKLASPFKDNEDNAEKDTEKDANESADAAIKAKKDKEAATKRSNFIEKIMRMRYVKQLKMKMKKSLMKNKEDKKYRKKKETTTAKGKRTRKIEEEEDMESNEQDGGSNNENEMLSEAKKEARSTKETLENGGRVPKKLLKCVKEEDDIAELDWKRIKMETRQKCLGRLEHHGDFNSEEEQIGIDLYKGLDVYIELLSDRIPVTRENNRVTKFENDQMMIEFYKQYRELFNDNEFNVSESFMDDYTDGDSDADDNNKKNDDEKETMEDGNKKNENEKKESRDENGTGTKECGTEAKDDRDDNIKDKYGSEAKDDGYEVKDNVNNDNDFENLLGDDTEDEVSMDIDIPNEEMK